MQTLKQVLMTRDGLSSEQAEEQMEEARQRIMDGDDPDEVLMEEFCLEPDYLIDLLY